MARRPFFIQTHRMSQVATQGTVWEESQSPSFSLEYFSCHAPPELVSQWLPKENHMTPLETLAAPVALHTWSAKLANTQLIHFIDNNSAASNLVKGYSNKSDTTPLIGDYWLTAAEHGIDIYIDRVESKSNLADGPSRFLLTTLDAWPHKRVQPCFPNPSVSPAFYLTGFGARLCSLSDANTS